MSCGRSLLKAVTSLMMGVWLPDFMYFCKWMSFDNFDYWWFLEFVSCFFLSTLLFLVYFLLKSHDKTILQQEYHYTIYIM
jgi:hypothetical protein